MRFSLFKSVPIPSYALPRRKRKRRSCSGTGYKDGQYPFVLYNRAVLWHKTKTKLLIFDFYIDCYNKPNDLIVRSIARDWSRICNEFIVGIKSYMDVSSEICDTRCYT